MENEKSKYVNGALGIAVKAIADVESLEYWVCNGEEYVTLHYINGSEAHICVTADSLSALAFDVFKYIKNH
jgi:hypothetical protein